MVAEGAGVVDEIALEAGVAVVYFGIRNSISLTRCCAR